jgi:hypothetical protein
LNHGSHNIHFDRGMCATTNSGNTRVLNTDP